MRGREEPFIVCRRGPGSFTFRPRGKKGWLQICVWAAAVLPLLAWFSGHASPAATGDDFLPALFLLCMGILAWVIGGLWWVFAHAEVIDHAVMLRDKQRARREKLRKG